MCRALLGSRSLFAALILMLMLGACGDPESTSPAERDEDNGVVLELDADPEPDMSGEDTGVDEDDASDADEPDAEVPDADAPDAEVPDADAPDAEVPDADAPDADPGLPDGPSSDRLRAVPKTTDEGAAPAGFYEYLPPGYGDGEPRPLLVFWHGLGENGNGTSELDRVLRNGPPKLQNQDTWSSDLPFITLSPQNASSCPSSALINDFFEWAVQNYNVDEDRVYLTGLSCGAIGSWNYLSNHQDTRVVASVLIAGDGQPAYSRAGCDLGSVAIWGFHGDADGTVNVAGTEQPIDQLLADCPAPPRKEVLKTIYPGVGHNSWSRTYDLSAGHDIYTWLLSKSR